jgi:DNA-binding transcriptional regulator YdaS (Cro superfamily)
MIIWESPLVLPAEVFPDMSDDEIALEVELMFQRANAISQAIKGEVSASDLAEIIRSQDISIDDWALHCDEFGERW